GQQAAAARHVLHQDRRLAGNMTAEMGGKGPGVEVVATSDVGGNDQPNRLAAIKFLAADGPCRRRQRHQCNQRPQHSRAPSTADIDKANGRYETKGWGRKFETQDVALWGISFLSPAGGSRR